MHRGLVKSKSVKVEPFDNLLCGNPEDFEAQLLDPEVAVKEVVTPGSIHDVLRLRGGGKEDSSSDKVARGIDLENILADDEVENRDLAERDGQADEEDEEANSGAKFLEQLDRDYLCSPRMVVRGVYVGEVLKLIVKRKTEGTYVDWTIFNMKTKTLVLNIKGEMTYPYALSREAQGTKFGHEVMGGWRWRGYGWGFINLFPNPDRPDPTKILHVDIDEAIFFQKSIFHHYHVSGRDCRNVNKAKDINCKQEGCGVRIWSITFTTYTTAEEEVEYYQPKKRRKEKEEQHVYLSLVAFFGGEFKIALHRGGRLKKYFEEVAWLSKDECADFNDSVAAVDRLKIEKARMIWETSVPKPHSEVDTLAAQVNIL